MNRYFKHLVFSCFLLPGLCCVSLLRAQNAFYLLPGTQMKIDTATVFTAIGNIILGQGAEFIHDGVLYVKNTTAVSTWSDLKASFTGPGLVVFQGTRDINYSGLTTFNNLTINGGAVNLANSSVLTVSNQLLLRLGVINTGTGASLNVANPSGDAIVADASNKGYSRSYINGVLKRKIDVNQVVYDFPVGNAGGVHLLSFINHLLTGVNGLTASFGVKKGNDVGIKQSNVSSYISVNENGVWYLQPDGTPAGGSYGLQLSLSGFRGLVDNGFSILARPLASSMGEDWVIPSGSSLPQEGAAGRTIASGFTQRDNITGFDVSQFGIGMSAVAPISTGLRLFPNPTNGIVNVDLPNAQEYTLVVTNAEGKKVLQQKITQTTQVQLAGLHPGTYMVSVFSAANSHISSGKVILIK